MWSRDGTELFFLPNGGQLMVVGVKTAPSLTFTNPVDVPRGFGVSGPPTPRTFDILPMPDGRIVGVGPSGQSPSGSGSAQIHVVLNWLEELKARAPVK
jgi:hypothetical protein